MSRLSPTHYGEYTSIYRLMTGKEHHSLYKKCSGSVVTAVDDSFVTISTPKGELKVGNVRFQGLLKGLPLEER